ncbi:hypothetical protein SCHPADRAFT_909472 [Schizopora paradoxa]|uniref:C2H2-type domain-containing protein n=1 Tax=Schizopora paradoxa TaxID=27342 RepID=A0A0H2R7V2_9AGAM|nr:hypothetical protein SCHPADRAFT_909472 [Schizopora paradoxa]
MLGAPYYQHHQAAMASRNASVNAFANPTMFSSHAQYPSFNQVPMCPQYNNFEQFMPQPVNVRQQRTLEIIKLEEVPAPVPGPSRPRRVPTASNSFESVPASSYDSDSSEESEEESGESYCSSDDALEQNVNIRRASSAEDEELEPVRIDDTFNSRMRRIEAWRNAYAKAVGAELAPSPTRSTTTTKRKGSDDDNDDTLSRSSKRSRRSASNAGGPTGSSASSASARSSAHSCSACDANFTSRQSLRRHGRSPRTNEACRAAVEYGFE